MEWLATHGEMGYAQNYHVERYFREIRISWIAPMSRQRILSPSGASVC